MTDSERRANAIEVFDKMAPDEQRFTLSKFGKMPPTNRDELVEWLSDATGTVLRLAEGLICVGGRSRRTPETESERWQSTYPG